MLTYRDVWKGENYTKCRSIGRMTYILQEICKELRRGNHQVAYATAIQGWKAARQYAGDGNSWRAAWHVTCLPDPSRKPKWSSLPQELSAVGGYLKAEADLTAKVKEGGLPGTDQFQLEDSSAGFQEEGQEGANPRKKKEKKEKKKGKDKKGKGDGKGNDH